MENAQEPLEDRDLLDPKKLGDVPIDDLINDAFLDILLDDLLVVDPYEFGESLGLQEFAEKSLQLSGEKSGGIRFSPLKTIYSLKDKGSIRNSKIRPASVARDLRLINRDSEPEISIFIC